MAPSGTAKSCFEEHNQEDSIFGFTRRRRLFYHGRTVLRIAKVAEAPAVRSDALSAYTPDVVGHPAVLRLDLADRLVAEGDLIQAKELAASLFSESYIPCIALDSSLKRVVGSSLV